MMRPAKARSGGSEFTGQTTRASGASAGRREAAFSRGPGGADKRRVRHLERRARMCSSRMTGTIGLHQRAMTGPELLRLQNQLDGSCGTGRLDCAAPCRRPHRCLPAVIPCGRAISSACSSGWSPAKTAASYFRQKSEFNPLALAAARKWDDRKYAMRLRRGGSWEGGLILRAPTGFCARRSLAAQLCHGAQGVRPFAAFGDGSSLSGRSPHGVLCALLCGARGRAD